MIKFIKWAWYRLLAMYRFARIAKHSTPKAYSDSLKRYSGRMLLSSDEINGEIIDLIYSGKPFLAGRLGATELLNMQSFDFGSYGKHGAGDRFLQLCNWSGFFPNDISLLGEFVDIMRDSVTKIDVLACWFHPFEDYYIKNFMPRDASLTYLTDLEPWSGSVHWSSALKGKKVLVIHPFSETIQQQYKNRKFIFGDSDILPEFQLITLQAVQTLAGTKDDRFNTWFDALNWMYEETKKIDFDIAIVGCGAYGLPLAAMIKNMGKQAIHLAGATQLLFGIKGKRWEEGEAFRYVREWFNEYWVYPEDRDRIKNGNSVEGACYWGEEKNEK